MEGRTRPTTLDKATIPATLPHTGSDFAGPGLNPECLP